MSDDGKNGKKWFPLESNPTVMNEYVKRMGCPDTFSFCDVYSTEEWALAMVPRPVLAVVMLFPIKDKVASLKKISMICIINENV